MGKLTAVAEVAAKHGIGISSVYSHLSTVRAYRKRQAVEEAKHQQNKIHGEKMMARRNAALESMRAKAKTETD